ncbi:MAG: hypothetical protein JNM45_08980 [Rhizobiales bacterium]|nr:hypothetical protein [Hyphomicrobiales bacterium]
MAETDLYLPVKRHLEAQGYAVKSEVKGCDVVAVRGSEPPVIVELKAALTLKLLYQAVERLTVAEHVYIAIARPKRGVGAPALKLCRRLGLGLIIVTAAGSLEVLADPVPYAPRTNTRKRGLLLKEFNARSGDPNLGGSTRKPLMTAYRQDALKCAGHLAEQGPARVRDVKAATRVDRAPGIFRDNVYGWFAKVERGVYGLTDVGRAALLRYGGDLSG